METKTLAGKYEIRDEIARGAFGVVYLAHHNALDRLTAIKALHAHYSQEPNFRKRFMREAKALAKLNHENIVGIYDIIEEDGIQHIVMEYVDGQSLDERLKNQKQLSLEEAVDIALQTARGLEYAHNFGIVHRDIKPGNIMINQENKVKLTDFGIVAAADEANLTMVGQVVGTPRYMSPEQAFGQEVDARSDIYSLGIVLYQMLTGKNPFDQMSSTQVLHELFTKEKELDIQLPENTPPELVELVYSMVEKDKEKRIGSTQLVVAALTQIKASFDSDKTNILFHINPTHSGGADQSNIQTQIDGEATTLVTPQSTPSYERHPSTGASIPTPTIAPSTTSGQSVVQTPPKSSGMPMVAIAAAVGLLVIGGGVFFMMQGGDEKTTVAPPVAQQTPPPKPVVQSDPKQGEAKRLAGELAVLKGQYESKNNELEPFARELSKVSMYTTANNAHQQTITMESDAKAAFDSNTFSTSVELYTKAIAQEKHAIKSIDDAEKDLIVFFTTQFSKADTQFSQTKTKTDTSRRNAKNSNADDLAANTWKKAESLRSNALETKEQAQRSFDENKYNDGIAYLKDANNDMLEANKLYRSARSDAIAQQQKAKQEELAKAKVKRHTKPTQQDYNTISTRLKQFERAYENRDMATLKKMVNFTPQQEKFLATLFSRFKTIEISISSLELTSDTAMVRVTIEHLINEKSEATIPGKEWQTSQFVIKKEKEDWGKFGWM